MSIITLMPILQVEKMIQKRLNYLLYEDSSPRERKEPQNSISNSQALGNRINFKREIATSLWRAKNPKQK